MKTVNFHVVATVAALALSAGAAMAQEGGTQGWRDRRNPVWFV